jgi:hypothetical protein
MKMGEVLKQFFMLNDSVIFYYPGIGKRSNHTYEEEFRKIEISMKEAGLDVLPVGITRDRIYTDPDSPCYRGNDFYEIYVDDLCTMRFDGILFLPDLMSWLCRDDGKIVQDAIDYVLRARLGVLFYDLAVHLDAGGQTRFEKEMFDFADEGNYLNIDSSGGRTVALRNL